MSWMPEEVGTGSIPRSSAMARWWTPKTLGMEGPVTSASRTPTARPVRRVSTASWLVTMDLPTPPLPETMP